MRTLLLPLIMQSALYAQAPISIASIGDALTGDPRLAPGSRVLVRLTQTVIPGSVSVQVGDKPAGIFGIFDDRVYVLLPFDVPPGPTALVVTSRGVSTPPFALTLVPHAPVLAPVSFWPGIYCPALAPWGTSLVAHGLGPTDPLVPAGTVTPTTPPASTVSKPIVTVAGREAEVLSAALVPGRTNDGSYAIDFRIPPGIPEGRHAVAVSVGGYTSNTDVLRVASAVAKSTVSGLERPGAPEALMSAYACAAPLGTGEAIGDARNPGGALLGTAVQVRDSAGVERVAGVLYVSPRQVNFVIPPGTANGPGRVIITSGDGSVSTAAIEIQAIAPELFSVSNYYPAALVLRVRDGVQTIEPVVRTVNGRIEPAPIDPGPATDQLFLLLFGTGLRGRTSLASVRATIGGVDAPIEYAGPQGEFAGLDQVNIRLPRSLSGRSGDLALWLTLEGRPVNEDELYLPFRSNE